MARAKDIAKVERVNAVRKERLDRLAQAARRDADAAAQACADAMAQEAAKARLVAAARASVEDDPACEHRRFWQIVCGDRREEAAGMVEVCDAASVAARTVLATRILNVRNHDLRSKRISDFGRTVRRGEARLAEMIAEDDAVPSRQGVSTNG